MASCQMGNKRLENIPPDILKDRNVRENYVENKGQIDSEICVDELVELCQKWSFTNVSRKALYGLLIFLELFSEVSWVSLIWRNDLILQQIFLDKIDFISLISCTVCHNLCLSKWYLFKKYSIFNNYWILLILKICVCRCLCLG